MWEESLDAWRKGWECIPSLAVTSFQWVEQDGTVKICVSSLIYNVACNSAVQCKEHNKVFLWENGQYNSLYIQVSALSPCSVHGISDFLQLIRSRYQPSSDAPMELQTVKAPFQLSLLQEDIVAYFLAGKPLIYTEPSSPLRIPFKFHHPTNSVEEADQWVMCMCVCEDAYIVTTIVVCFKLVVMYVVHTVLWDQLWIWIILLKIFLIHSR